MRGRRQLHPVRLQLPGRVRVPRAHLRSGSSSSGPAGRARGRPRVRTPGKVWLGLVLIAMALLALPFALAYAGTAWVRIANFALLYVLLALGLNLVVGFAGLLDLGYIAFYAIGAYTYALLASPHFNLRLA